ncbi:MAG: KH domain-containing protein [Caldisphaeraceae archaeon]|nr:KH domain-containing protein [Caldisphaeraceae archaeon]
MHKDENAGKIEKWVKLYAQIPVESYQRIASEIEKLKELIKKDYGVSITLDNENSIAIIKPVSESSSPANLMKVKDLIAALSIGFTGEEAMELLRSENILITIDIKSRLGNSKNHVRRILGRIIGEGGRAKRTLEEITGTRIHIGSHAIGIIGDYDRSIIAQYGIDMLIEGRMHGTVYRKLEEMMREVKRREIGNIWQKRYLE